MHRPDFHMQEQGTVIVEPGEIGLLMMFPDGQVENAASAIQAERKARAWFKDNIEQGAVGVGKIEWRRCGPAMEKTK